MAKLEIKETLLALILIVFGVLVIAVPNLIEWLVGIAFIVLGVVHFIPEQSKK
jgi:multisubunit Na+/H+ antiporter MnhC subunit